MLVLSVQILPVRQMGKLLLSNQLTEELPHSCDECKDCMMKYEPTIPAPFADLNLLQTRLLATVAFRFSHAAAELPNNHAGEIHTPPPNVTA